MPALSYASADGGVHASPRTRLHCTSQPSADLSSGWSSPPTHVDIKSGLPSRSMGPPEALPTGEFDRFSQLAIQGDTTRPRSGPNGYTGTAKGSIYNIIEHVLRG